MKTNKELFLIEPSNKADASTLARIFSYSVFNELAKKGSSPEWHLVKGYSFINQ